MRDEASSRFKKFLISPDQARFSDIFDSTFVFIKGYLIYLRQKGYRLPLDMYSKESAIDDLALDILGGLFQSKRGRPFHIIFDYYRAYDLIDFRELNPVRLWDMFEKLAKGFTHQELARIRKKADPQVEVLKRRFKDILKDEIYAVTVQTYMEFVHLATCEPDFMRPVIRYEELVQLTERAFSISTSRSAWCQKIFEMLAENYDLCHAVPRCELLRAVVAVNAAFLELPEFRPAGLPGPQESAIRQTALDLMKQTMRYVEENVIRPFVVKKRISAEDAPQFLAACARYLDDYGTDGDPDAIPAYFREVMPVSYSDRYLKDFKYVFEVVLQKAKEDFTCRLRKNPIIRQFGVYWNIEG